MRALAHQPVESIVFHRPPPHVSVCLDARSSGWPRRTVPARRCPHDDRRAGGDVAACHRLIVAPALGRSRPLTVKA
jgi:hypothetical protein